MKPLRLFPAAFVLLAVLMIPGSALPAWDGTYPYKVTATVGMVADIVSNVAGDKAEITTLMGAGVDPHTYAPSRGDTAALLKADVVFYSGLLLEGRMSDMLVKVSRQRPVYAVTELIRENFLLEKEAGIPDPHIWMDVQGWIKATEAASRSLAEFDPANAEFYATNAKSHVTTLQELDRYAKRTLASIPEKQRVMITAHDAFSYMGRAYGIEVHGIQGLSTESEAGLQDINRLVEMIVQRRIPAVFVETSVSDKNVRALQEGAKSRGHDVTIGGSLFSDAMGPKGTYEGTYVGMIDHNVTTIARALGGNAPADGMQGKLTGKR